ARARQFDVDGIVSLVADPPAVTRFPVGERARQQHVRRVLLAAVDQEPYGAREEHVAHVRLARLPVVPHRIAPPLRHAVAWLYLSNGRSGSNRSGRRPEIFTAAGARPGRVGPTARRSTSK